jgi:hypothetical protein
LGLKTASARDANHEGIDGIQHPANVLQVGGTLAVPVAEKANAFGFLFGLNLFSSFGLLALRPAKRTSRLNLINHCENLLIVKAF